MRMLGCLWCGDIDHDYVYVYYAGFHFVYLLKYTLSIDIGNFSFKYNVSIATSRS